MRPFIFLLIIHIVNPIIAQSIYDYEKEIELSDEYSRQEIRFKSLNDDVELSGTLIYPNTDFKKLVIIVPGSGKDTRHSHFILAEEFLKHKIAVYRFDERGIGQSEGKYRWSKETATTLEKDVISAFKKLKKLDLLKNKKIGILGHSLGGIASIGALKSGCNFDFLIQMATPVENNGAFLTYQVLTNISGFYTVKGKTTEEVINFVEALRKICQPEEDYKTTKKKAKALIKRMKFRKGKHITDRVIIDLMKQNHEETYQTCKVPLLYIIGSEDKIVSSKDETQVLRDMKNPAISIAEISGVDHYLENINESREQEKSPYYINDIALKNIVDWTLNK